MSAVTTVTTCCGELRQSLYKMQRGTYATGDLKQPKSRSYVMDRVPVRVRGCEF
jgi:hypothetical protein